MKPDETLDQLLQSRPIQADPSFADQTLERIRREADAPSSADAPGARSPGVFKPWAMGLAAALVVLVGLAFLLLDENGNPPTPEDLAPTTPPPAIAFEPAPTREAPAASEALTNLSEDEFYALEDSLAELDVLMEEDNLAVLTLLSSDLI